MFVLFYILFRYINSAYKGINQGVGHFTMTNDEPITVYIDITLPAEILACFLDPSQPPLYQGNVSERSTQFPSIHTLTSCLF